MFLFPHCKLVLYLGYESYIKVELTRDHFRFVTFRYVSFVMFRSLCFVRYVSFVTFSSLR